MTDRQDASITHLKLILYAVAAIFATATAILLIFSANAAVPHGRSPALAPLLVEKVNKGQLNPEEQHWFKFVGDVDGRPVDLEKSFTLIFTPGRGESPSLLSFNVFEEALPEVTETGATIPMTNVGSGWTVSRDGNPETGELFWSDRVFGTNTYYLQIVNQSNAAVDYWLFDNDFIGQNSPAPPPATSAVLPEAGLTPSHPLPLADDLTRNKLAAHTTHWYTLRYDDPTGQESFKELDFTMFATPDQGQSWPSVNFELFPLKNFEQWQQGELAKMSNAGAGMQVSRDNDQNTSERAWHGWLPTNETYLLAVRNDSDLEIDYWLFDEEIHNPELGVTSPVIETEPVFTAGTSPQSALPLEVGVNKGGLAPGQEAWYSFAVSDGDSEVFEEMALTMVVTPDNGSRIQYVPFEVYTVGGAQNWSPGSELNTHVGAGSIVQRDDNPVTGERFWQGWIVEGESYLIRIRNGADVHMDYWLYPADVYQPALGE